MDRRRFRPSTEGLEGRAMLSTFLGASNYSTSNRNHDLSVRDSPQTFDQKLERISHLPFYLHTENPQRYLPLDTIHEIESDMTTTIDVLHGVDNTAVRQFDLSLRHIYPYKTLDINASKIINHSFGTILSYAGATPGLVAKFQADMNTLALADSHSIEPARLAANDYSLVLQTTLTVGRPIKPPTAPQLAIKDGIRLDHGRAAATRLAEPTFVGQYLAGQTKNESVNMVILDGQGQVLGSGPVQPDGDWSVTNRLPLAPGTYQIFARSLDTNGFVSGPSHGYTLKVLAPHPRGPLS